MFLRVILLIILYDPCCEVLRTCILIPCRRNYYLSRTLDIDAVRSTQFLTYTNEFFRRISHDSRVADLFLYQIIFAPFSYYFSTFFSIFVIFLFLAVPPDANTC